MADPTTSQTAIHGCNIRLMRGGAGEPLVVLPGASGAGPWQPFMGALAEKFDVIVPEHPGFGESDTPEWLDTIHDLAYFDLDLLAALGLDRVHLVGISLGGWVAAELAVRNTRRLASLTLIGAAGLHVKGVAQIDPFLRTDEQRIRDFFHDQACADEVVKRVLAPELADVAMKNQVTTAKLSWQPRGHDPHLHKWLHRIDVPTLLVWGAEDKLFPKDYAYAYRDLIADAKVVIVPECGHVPHVEKPAAFVSAVAEFIDAKRLAA
jgi:pimeloyl-ACP methyl ester carboxylesterase